MPPSLNITPHTHHIPSRPRHQSTMVFIKRHIFNGHNIIMKAKCQLQIRHKTGDYDVYMGHNTPVRCPINVQWSTIQTGDKQSNLKPDYFTTSFIHHSVNHDAVMNQKFKPRTRQLCVVVGTLLLLIR